MSYQKELLKTAHDLANSIYETVNKNFRCISDWKEKTPNQEYRNQVITNADIECEKIMRQIINKKFPNHGIIGEELGSEKEDSEFVWVLDPIDGTKAFISGLPVFGTMIGLLENKKPIVGVIDQPITKERVWGSEDGSYLNGKKIKTRKCNSLKNAICAITDPAMFNSHEQIYSKIYENVFFIRHGTDCWGYAMCAAGNIDLVIENDLKIWDVAAASSIITYAGGKISSWNGSNPNSSSNIVASGDPVLHDICLDLLKY